MAGLLLRPSPIFNELLLGVPAALPDGAHISLQQCLHPGLKFRSRHQPHGVLIDFLGTASCDIKPKLLRLDFRHFIKAFEQALRELGRSCRGSSKTCFSRVTKLMR